MLLILTEFPPSFGGMQTHAAYLCRFLHDRGYSIAVATYRQEGGEEFDRTLPFPVHRVLSRIGYWHNVRSLSTLACRLRADLVYSSTVFYGQLRAAVDVPMICRSAGNDVLRPWIAWPYTWLSRVVSEPWFEDLLYERFRRLDWPERIEALLLHRRRLAMLDSAACMSRVFANSEFTAGLLQSISVPRDRVQVLPGGVDAARFYPAFRDRASLRRELGLPAGKFILMSACRLVAKKGIDLLLGALPALQRRIPDVHLVIIGDGRDREKLENLAAALRVTKAVTFAGYVRHGEVHRYYWCADQFILASREHVHHPTGLRDVETMGRVLCEANAAGVPVIATRSGGIPSVIAHGRNGLLFNNEEDTGQLVDLVDRLHSDPLLAARLRDAGLRMAASKFDWSVICEAHEREFRGHSEETSSARFVVP